jgi:hypothetical protein
MTFGQARLRKQSDSQREHSKGVIVKKVRVPVMVVLTALILMGCIPSKARGFSIYLLADGISATELLPVDLKDLELEEEPILSSDDIFAIHSTTPYRFVNRLAQFSSEEESAYEQTTSSNPCGRFGRWEDDACT